MHRKNNQHGQQGRNSDRQKRPGYAFAVGIHPYPNGNAEKNQCDEERQKHGILPCLTRRRWCKVITTTRSFGGGSEGRIVLPSSRSRSQSNTRRCERSSPTVRPNSHPRHWSRKGDFAGASSRTGALGRRRILLACKERLPDWALAVSSVVSPPVRARLIAMRSAGRDRLPACVVRIRSVLDFIPPLPIFQTVSADGPQLLPATVFDFRLQLHQLVVQLRRCRLELSDFGLGGGNIAISGRHLVLCL